MLHRVRPLGGRAGGSQMVPQLGHFRHHRAGAGSAGHEISQGRRGDREDEGRIKKKGRDSVWQTLSRALKENGKAVPVVSGLFNAPAAWSRPRAGSPGEPASDTSDRALDSTTTHSRPDRPA